MGLNGMTDIEQVHSRNPTLLYWFANSKCWLDAVGHHDSFIWAVPSEFFSLGNNEHRGERAGGVSKNPTSQRPIPDETPRWPLNSRTHPATGSLPAVDFAA